MTKLTIEIPDSIMTILKAAPFDAPIEEVTLYLIKFAARYPLTKMSPEAVKVFCRLHGIDHDQLLKDLKHELPAKTR